MSKEQYIEFPEEYTRRELNARYREIPLKDTTSRLLRKYFNAMANLYGIIPLHKAKDSGTHKPAWANLPIISSPSHYIMIPRMMQPDAERKRLPRIRSEQPNGLIP